MESKINLELKYFCSDFRPVRALLREIGARKIHAVQQKDYFFNLPNRKSSHPRRLKLREENGRHMLVYYERPNFSARLSTKADVKVLTVLDSGLREFLSTAFGVKAVVEKKRELWRKGHTVFHLDTVKNVGKVFEIEVWTNPKTLSDDKVDFAKYRRQFLPYLGAIIRGSNANIVVKHMNQ